MLSRVCERRERLQLPEIRGGINAGVGIDDQWYRQGISIFKKANIILYYSENLTK